MHLLRNQIDPNLRSLHTQDPPGNSDVRPLTSFRRHTLRPLKSLIACDMTLPLDVCACVTIVVT